MLGTRLLSGVEPLQPGGANDLLMIVLAFAATTFVALTAAFVLYAIWGERQAAKQGKGGQDTLALLQLAEGGGWRAPAPRRRAGGDGAWSGVGPSTAGL